MERSVLRHRRRARGWVAATVGTVLVAVGAAGVVILGPRDSGDGRCSDLTIAVSPDQAPVMTQLADQWVADVVADGDRCAEITVEAAPSNVTAATLSSAWNEDRVGARPDVWVPESSIWAMVAAARPDAAGMLPDQPASRLASSPVVLAMQRPMAEALGWPDRDIGWTDLLGAFGGGQTWEQFGQPEWGPFRLGIADPTGSTAGIAGVLTALDPDGGGTLSDEELLGGIALSQLVTVQEADTDALLAAYTGTGSEASQLPAAFPLLERDLAVHAADEPAVPLVPVYLREGVVFADYPYLVLQASWVDEDRRRLAAEFLAYLRSPSGRQAYAAAGFRDAGHSAAGVPLLSAADGFAAEIPAPARTPTAESLGEILGMWPVLVRPNNLLIVLDTSGSMGDAVPGTDLTRLQLLQNAAAQGVGLLNDQTVVGLWEFSTELTPATPYRELVPTGPAGEDLGGVDRRQAMLGAIQGLRPNGGTGLYDTVHDAYLAMQQAWQADAQNLLVVITDGRDEDHDGRTLPELLGALEGAVQPDRPLPIIALAVGPEADAESLEQITQITGGRTVIARDDVDAIQQVVLAFAGRIS